MKLNQLEYFCAVCRYHSITRAAEELYVTQPTISVAIRELERAEALLKETRAMVSEFTSLGEKETPIKIGIPPLISTVFFPSLTDGFQEKTGLPVQLFEYGSVKACNMVQEEKLDCALVNMDFYNIDQFNSHVLMEDTYVYCVGRNHRYAGETEVTFDMLKDEKLILFNTDSVQNETVTARYRAMGLEPNVIAYTSQLYTILNFLRSGSCGALLYSVLAVNPRDFVQIPISPEINSKFGVIWKKGIFMPDRTNKFIEYIKKYSIIR